MATRTGTRSAGRKGASTGGRIAAGRGRAGRPVRGGRKAKTRSGPMGMVSRVGDTIGRTGSRGAKSGGGVVGNAANFVRGFLSGNQKGGRRRR